MAMKVLEVIKLIEEDGWYLVAPEAIIGHTSTHPNQTGHDRRSSRSRFGSRDAEQHFQAGAVGEARKGKGQVEKMNRFLIVIEKANGNYSAYSPDLPGCVTTGKTQDRVTQNMYEAIDMHIRGLLQDSLPVPESHFFAEFIAIPSETT